MVQTASDNDLALLAKFDRVVNMRLVSESKGSVFHCPTADCLGIVNLRNEKLFARSVQCQLCGGKICTQCRELWHDS